MCSLFLEILSVASLRNPIVFFVLIFQFWLDRLELLVRAHTGRCWLLRRLLLTHVVGVLLEDFLFGDLELLEE